MPVEIKTYAAAIWQFCKRIRAQGLGVVTLLAAITTIVVNFSVISNPGTPADRQSNSEPVRPTTSSDAREKARECYSEITERLTSDDTSGLGRLVFCAETGFRSAMHSGDMIGAYGLADLYFNQKLEQFLSEQGSRPEMDAIAGRYWCQFAESDQGKLANIRIPKRDNYCDGIQHDFVPRVSDVRVRRQPMRAPTFDFSGTLPLEHHIATPEK